MTGAAFPWPPYAHVPGRTPRHGPALFEAVKAATPTETRSDAAAANPAWRHGLALLDAGLFWECHEALEPVWLNARPNGLERLLLQAVIQIANSGLKRAMDRPQAAARLTGMALDLIGELPTDALVMGLSRADVEAAAMAAGRGGATALLKSAPAIVQTEAPPAKPANGV